ncbi:universal stress protein [Ruoffia tabacinasalis]|uniref:Universal stress protein n=1 Tax=Ruoffia tabacinasalis TaxID=87458 RepID=A0ABS0LID2_9LACT|nr:universal stress protein [Ruoffia tabacinasalis]MBG9977171.1 universal stress protein [Ruoffia tabacinasalis]
MLQEYQRILVATDGSEGADLALNKAVAIAKRNNAKLFVLHVLDTRAIQATSSSDIHFREALRTLGDRVMEEAKDYATGQGLTEVETILEMGSPKSIIAEDIPKREGIDLIVMGAKGMGAIERFFMGSVSENVIRHAACDVLVVRPDEL